MSRDVIAIAALHSLATFDEANALTLKFEARALHSANLKMAEVMFPSGFRAFISKKDEGPLEARDVDIVRKWLEGESAVSAFIIEGPMGWNELQRIVLASDGDYPWAAFQCAITGLVIACCSWG